MVLMLGIVALLILGSVLLGGEPKDADEERKWRDGL